MPPDITTGSASGNAKWTVMVFMGAATIEGNVPLLEAAEADLAEMRFVGSGPVEKGFGRPGDELNIFVQVHQGGDIVPRRGRITENMVGGIQALDEVQADQRDTRRGAALGHFIRTSLESAYHSRLNPEHYSLLVLWGHAYDFAIGRTPTTDGMIDALDFAELARVLELLQLQFGHRLFCRRAGCTGITKHLADCRDHSTCNHYWNRPGRQLLCAPHCARGAQRAHQQHARNERRATDIREPSPDRPLAHPG